MKTEVEPRTVADRSVATRHVGVHRVGRLHVGERGYDDAPDALDRVEREQAAVPLHQTAQHLRFARRAEGRAARARLLDGDEGFNDLAALDEQGMHRPIQPVDLGADVGKGRIGWERHGGFR